MYSKMPKQPKQWETWHGMHTFLCDGRIMLGPDIGVTGFAAGLTTAASVAFWVWVCPQLPSVVLVGGALLYALTMFFMIACATTDPGILPRDPTVDDATAAANAELRRTVLVNGARCRSSGATCRIPAAAPRHTARVQRLRRALRPPLPVDGPVHRQGNSATSSASSPR